MPSETFTFYLIFEYKQVILISTYKIYKLKRGELGLYKKNIFVLF